MADVAIFPAMNFKDWRIASNRTLAECAEALGIEGGGRTLQRIETGENRADADMVERILAFTGGEVTAQDMHAVRLAWLKENRPEKFAPRVAA